MRELQSRYANIKCNMSKTGLTPQEVARWIRSEEPGEGGWPDAECFWAVHDEPGKELHFHMVVRFRSPVRWSRLGSYLDNLDPHNYSQPARAFNRSVRYLLHLDNPEKTPISRESFNFSENVDDSEVSLILGAPRSCILHDIRNLPKAETFTAFDWLVNQRGHSPNEVTQVLRCLMAINEWTKRILEDTALQAQLDYSEGVGIDPFKESEFKESEFEDDLPLFRDV